MKKVVLVLLICNISFKNLGQDTSPIGRFSAGILASYSKSNIGDEAEKGGQGLQLRYFPTPKTAFVLSYQKIRSSVERFGKVSNAVNSSLGFGFEKHITYGNFSPYIGIESGLNIIKVKSTLLKLPPNDKYFQNNLANYLLKPKLGIFYKINENLLANFEGSFIWIITPNKANTGVLYDDSYSSIYFGRKIPTISIGIHYLFEE